jgi:hypothetical protein
MPIAPGEFGFMQNFKQLVQRCNQITLRIRADAATIRELRAAWQYPIDTKDLAQI